MQLSKDVFVALAAIAWADGEVTGSERDALLSAAHVSGVMGSDLDAVRDALTKRTDLESLRGLSLGAEEKSYVYALASWLTRADGIIRPEETKALATLGDLLGLNEDDRQLAAISSLSVGAFDDADDPSTHDVTALAKEIERAAREG